MSDSEDIQVNVLVPENIRSILPYQHEPENSSSESETIETDTSDDFSDHYDDRRENTDWCRCGKCDISHLVNEKEFVCCLEVAKTRNIAKNQDNCTCVTNNDDFEVLCKNNAVLKNVLKSLNHIRGDDWDISSTRSLRWAAYRQFTWWIHGKLGPKVRIVIPACASHSIRTTFPAADGESFEGYQSTEDN